MFNLEELNSFFQDIQNPPAMAIAFFMIGVYFVINCSGISTGIQFGGISLRSPSSKRGRYIHGFIGLLLITASIFYSLAQPIYSESLRESQVYHGNDAKQIVEDGYNVFLLTDSGKILDLTQDNRVLLNNENDIKKIEPAGGLIYILNDNESVFAEYEFSGSHPNETKRQKYNGISINQIIPAGEILYILERNGNILKIEPTRNGTYEGVTVDSGDSTKQIEFSGSLLYGLKNDGSVFETCPAINATGYKYIDKIKDADKISADGETLYFITKEGSTWMYRHQDDTVSCILNGHEPKDLDAVGGIVYILTKSGEVFRYSMDSPIQLKNLPIGKNKEKIQSIAAYGHEFFAINDDHNVYRYSENIIKRSA
jgi:hypothetical protein